MRNDLFHSILEGKFYTRSKWIKKEKFNIGVGALGNGLTIYDMNRQENNDYKIIAHIQPWGEITWRDSGLSQRVKELIEQQASIEKNENKMAEGGEAKYEGIYKRMTPQQHLEAQEYHQQKEEYYKIKGDKKLQKYHSEMRHEHAQARKKQ